MPTTIYDSSLITKRIQNKTIANSFINRIQNGNNSTTGSAPIIGIMEQSIINSVKSGQMIDFRKNEGGCVTINRGCPCNQPTSPIIEAIVEAIRGWATSIGGTGIDTGYGITTDSYGNVYVIVNNVLSSLTINNFSSNPVTPGGAINITPYGTLSNSGNQDAFIVKYTTNGLVQWATSIGGTGSDIGNSITTDSSGNVYIIGNNFSSSLTINNFSSNPVTPGGAINITPYGTLSSSANQDAFIVKYTTNGLVQWATSIGGTDSDSGNSIATDSSGNVYVTGSYNSSLLTINNFSSNPVTPGGAINITSYGTLSTSGVSFDTYIVKYNTNGLVQWATSIGGTDSDSGNSIATDSSGNVYVIGNYISTVLTINSFLSGGGGGAINITPYGTLSNSGNQDTFIVKYTTNGLVQWATSIGGTGSDIGNSITTDSSGNVYVTGFYNSTVLTINSFLSGGGGGAINITPYGTLSNSGNQDAFIVKYNTNGLVQWATSIGGTINDIGNSITTDSSGNVYITGYYSSAVLTINSFVSGGGGGPINVTPYGTLSTSGLTDIYIVKYTTNGLIQWATSIGGTSNNFGDSIATDSSGNVYVTGSYNSAVLTINSFSSNPFTPGGAINITPYGTLSNSGMFDIYIVKYNTNGQIL
jgi:hypothetical protein